MQLRDYQKEQLEFLLNSKNAVIQSPTGTGKSLVLKSYIDEYLRINPDDKIAVITPNQTLNRNIAGYLGNRATLAHTGNKPDLNKQILVTTFHSGQKYLPDFKPELIIGDELHRVRAERYEKCFQYGKLRKGFTATPNRHDGKGLSTLFDEIYLSPQISWFIGKGYLADYDLISIDAPMFECNTDSYHLQEEIFGTQPEIKKTVDTYLEKGRGQTLIFCTTILHGKCLQQEFLKRGVESKFVCSKKEHSDNLEESLEGFKNGEFPILINCQMFVEGVDVPQIETLMLCCFTFSTPKYLQMVGRLLRPFKGIKKLLIDLAGNIFYHGSPKNFFEWNLEGYENDKQPDNKNSLWHYCFSCDEPITRKKNVLIPSSVCCLNCGATQQVLPVNKKQKVDFLGEEFTLLEYNSETLEVLVAISKVVKAGFKEYSKLEKLKIISQTSLPDELKIKAMLATGASENTIEQFL
ncbi:MAG: DEAD/DEAH box helicase family protein [Richelia sp. SM1_7_0]|nr:DEAD/DEAH box helicase family protein [Richelia sp. SM1_7_0]